MGNLLKIPAGLIYVIGGFWGFFICIGIVHDKLGFIGAVISFFLLPFTIYLAPWYVAFVDGNWHPLIVIYGSGIVAFILAFVGTLIDGD
jgi:hypothetical protein